MAKGVRTRIKAPDAAAPGETVVIKTRITHKMENGERRDGAGRLIPRSIVNRFRCQFEGETVIDIRLEPSIAANPYFRFEMRVPEDAAPEGRLIFTWNDDDGSVYRDAHAIRVG